MTYTNDNLVLYEDAIRLHFDETGKTAWLTMRNYGYVFGAYPDDAVKVVTVGSPTPSEHRESISISSWLDVVDIIRFQVGLLAISAGEARAISLETLLKVIKKVLESISAKTLPEPNTNTNSHFFKKTCRLLVDTWLSSYAGRSDIAEAIRNYCTPGGVVPKRAAKTSVVNTNDAVNPDEEELVDVGFVAYLPRPDLIQEEQRTTLDGDQGKTVNRDTREIFPILTDMAGPKAVKVAIIDKQPKQLLPKKEGNKPQSLLSEEWEFQWIVDELDNDSRVKHPDKPTEKRLHIQLERITCFAFRGDSRDPIEHKKAMGFLPGMTRTDKGVADFKHIGDRLDRTSAPRPRLEEPTDLQTIDPEYLKVIKEFSLMHLGMYTANPDFKGYISASKSTAMAKCFSNFYPTQQPGSPNYCFAVRCRGGFHLNSDLPGQLEQKEIQKRLREIHDFNNYAEQEVAVPGAIWWENVVGVRLAMPHTGNIGQLFYGPIFFKPELIWQENEAFSEMFELLSGRSQGEAEGIIERSYEKQPFECAQSKLATMGANLIQPASIADGPLVRITPQLEFGRQPIGTESAYQEVKITNLGPGSLTIRRIFITKDELHDFHVISALDLNALSLELNAGQSFTVKVQFCPTQKRPEQTKRIAILDIATSKARLEKGDSTRTCSVRLTGTAVPELDLVYISQTMLEFHAAKKVGSVSQMLALANRSKDSLRFALITSKHFKTNIQDLVLKAGEDCLVEVTFEAPKQKTKYEGTLEITCGPKTRSVRLTGYSEKALYVVQIKGTDKNGILDFGTMKVGVSSSYKYGTLSNTGNAAVKVDSIEILPEGKFNWEFIGEVGGKNLALLLPGESRRIRLWFTPQSPGYDSAKLIITFVKNVTGNKLILLQGIGY